MTEPKDWKIEIKNIDDVQLDDAKFIFEQAEKKFEDTHSTAELIVGRTFTLLGILMTIVIALSGYLYGQISQSGFWSNKILTLLVAVIYLYGIIWYLKPNVFPKSYFSKGAAPKKLFVQDFFAEKHVEKQKTTIYLYINEIERLQGRIEKNEELNDKRWEIYKNAINALIISPVLFICLYLLMSTSY